MAENKQVGRAVWRRHERLVSLKSELLKMCDDNPSYWQKQILDNIDDRISEMEATNGEA